ncbi:hypothetical protein R6Z07F_010705 [Ovis aries]
MKEDVGTPQFSVLQQGLALNVSNPPPGAPRPCNPAGGPSRVKDGLDTNTRQTSPVHGGSRPTSDGLQLPDGSTASGTRDGRVTLEGIEPLNTWRLQAAAPRPRPDLPASGITPLARNSVPTNPTGCGPPCSEPSTAPPLSDLRPPAPRLPSPSPLTRGRARLGRVTLSGRTTARSRGGGAGRQTPPYQRRAELRQTHIPGRPHGSGSSEVQWNLRTVARPVLSAAQPAPPPRSPEWLRPRGPVGGGEGVEETIPGEGRMS